MQGNPGSLLDNRFDRRKIDFMIVETNERASGELLGFFRALADANRLKIVGLLSQRAYSVEQLAALLDLGESTVSHHLSRLAEAELVTARAEGHYSIYSLQLDALSGMAQRLLRTERLPELAEGIDLGSFDKKVLAAFTGPDGRFTAFPVQKKKFLVSSSAAFLNSLGSGERHIVLETNAPITPSSYRIALRGPHFGLTPSS